MKKVFSLVLSLVMLLSVTTGITITAQAATGSEIVTYARQFIGYPYVWGTQGPSSFDCSGFVQYVFKHFGISLPASSDSYWSNPTAYGTVVGTGSTSNAQAGDVISWSGHVAIYTGNGNCVEALNPSYGVTESVPVNSHTNGTNYKVIRINGVSGSYVPSPVVGDNKNYVSVGESIAFWYSGLTECSKAEFYFEKDGEVYYTKDSTSSREFVTYFESEGIYNVYAGGYYNGQWYYSSKITVYVFNPKLVSNKTSVHTNEEVTFTYSGLSACQSVNICFEKDGNTYYSGDSTSSRVYKNYFENPGVYYVYAKGTVKNYTTNSDKIKITVTCNHTYSKKVTKEATCKAVGLLKYTCSKCGDNYTETIPKTAHKTVVDKAVDPTCTVDGKTEGSHCSVCGKILIAQEKVKAIGHKEVIDAAVPATFTSEGKTEGKHCSVCGAVLVAQKRIAKLSKKTNTISVKVKKPTVKLSKLKKKNQTISLTKWIAVSKAQGTVTYKKSNGNKKITVSQNGKITVKKGLKKGTYTVKIKVTAAGNTEYNAAVKTVTVKIKVK